jgi:hypothetical protein
LSKDASIWEDKKSLLSFSVALSRAWIEEGRPMIKGTSVEGKTTSSLNGIKGTLKIISELLVFSMLILRWLPPSS